MALALRAGRLRRGAGARLCAAARDAADRDQSEMGARRDDGGGAQSRARASASRPPTGARARSPTRTSRSTPAIGRHGLKLIEEIAATKKPGEPVNVLTHCNAGWLATVDWGTATSPIYQAHDKGIPVHVWVDETRPRNQGASLTAWELGQHGVPHTVIPDNTGGHLMQHGASRHRDRRHRPRHRAGRRVRTRSARISRRSPRKDNGVPFYVALPSPTIDFTVNDGVDGNPDRAARRRRSHHHDRRAPPTAASRACASCRTARRSRTTAST